MKNDRKIYSILLSMLVVIVNTLFLSNTVYADDFPTNEIIVDVNVTGDDNGQVKSGTEIEILYTLSNLKNMYAASIDLTYDNSLIKVNSIEPCEKISGNVYEAYKETAKDGNRARYGFTFLGEDEQGLTGKVDFVKIKATALKDGELDVKKSNTKFEIVQKIDKKMDKAKVVYMNSQGETVKVELKEPGTSSNNDKANKESASEDTSAPSSSKDKEEEKVTVLGTNNSTKAVSIEESSTDATEQNSSNEKTEEEITAKVEDNNSESEEKTSDEGTEESRANKEHTEVSKSNSTLVIGGVVLVIGLAVAGGVYFNKRKNS